MYFHADDPGQTSYESGQGLVHDVGGPGEAPVPRPFEYIERTEDVEEAGQCGELGLESLNDFNDLASLPAIAPSMALPSGSPQATRIRRSALASLKKWRLFARKPT